MKLHPGPRLSVLIVMVFDVSLPLVTEEALARDDLRYLPVKIPRSVNTVTSLESCRPWRRAVYGEVLKSLCRQRRGKLPRDIPIVTVAQDREVRGICRYLVDLKMCEAHPGLIPRSG